MANSPARAVVDVGTVIAGTYTIEALIGRGGMGAVFLASHNRLPGKKVAIKLLHAEISDPETLARFKREAQIASMLGHPNIVHVEDFDVMADGTPYLVLEYLHGETLAQRLASGPLAVEQILSIVRQVGSALAAAHRAGVVHRDLKPQNIFLVPTELDGRPFELAKVLDFGISKMRGSQTVKTQESALLGTPQYMAPEQATGQQSSVDERTDIFALGAIVYEMVSGHPAFVGGSIPEVVFKVVYEQPRPLAEEAPTVSATIANAVHQAMAKPQADRFPTVNSFVEALTGESLRSMNRPAPAAPAGEPGPGSGSGSKVKSTGKEAFDRTVGSGDHQEAMGVAATVGSGDHSAEVAKAVAAPVAEKAPRRSRAPIAIAVVVACAAGAAGVFFVMKQQTPAPAASPSPSPVHTPPTTAPAPTHAEPVRKTDEPDERDPVAREELKAAEVELLDQHWMLTRQHANRVLNSPDSAPFQKARAHMLLGIVACHASNDQEGAQRELRQINVPKLRTRLIGACREDHIPLSPR